MRVVYMGTPDFAVKPLEALISNNYEVVGVFTQPDKPVGRKAVLTPPPVKVVAENNNIPVFQPDSLKNGEGVRILETLKPDVVIVVAYGKILPKDFLAFAKYGCINIHGSILPEYRGAAPIQWAVINGEKVTGITILKSDVGMDDGDIISLTPVEVLENETAGELFDRLAEIGANCLIDALTMAENGTITYTPQNHAEATVCKMLKKEISVIDFSKSNTEIKNLILGLNPWPVAEMNLMEGRFKVYRAELVSQSKQEQLNLSGNYSAGEVLVASPKQGLIIACGVGLIEITELQAENGKIMPAKSLLNGKKIALNQIANN